MTSMAPVQFEGIIRRYLAQAFSTVGVQFLAAPWGKQWGAHLNPSTTFTFFRLGKIDIWDAVFYVLAQFIGAAIGVFASKILWRQTIAVTIANPSVRYAATVPGRVGTFAIAFGSTSGNESRWRV